MIEIQVRKLSKKFETSFGGFHVLSLFSHKFVQGRFYLIKAESGKGKSTLLHLIGGLDKPSSGEIVVDWGKEPLNLKQLFGFAFQDHNLLPEFSVAENLKIPLLAQGLSDYMIDKKIDEFLRRFGLLELKNMYANQLSGGQRQRISIIRAAIAEPFFILADEPTASLDEKNSVLVKELFLELKKIGIGLIVSSHNSIFDDAADEIINL